MDGEINATEPDSMAHKCALGLLLDNRSTTGSGEWVRNKYTKLSSLEIILGGTSPTLTMAIYGSNAKDQPPSSFDGTKIGSDISSAGLTTITMPCRWIKAKIAAIGGTAPTVTARLHQVY